MHPVRWHLLKHVPWCSIKDTATSVPVRTFPVAGERSPDPRSVGPKVWFQKHLNLGAHPWSSLWILFKSLISVFCWLGFHCQADCTHKMARWVDAEATSQLSNFRRKRSCVSWKSCNKDSLAWLDHIVLITVARGWSGSYWPGLGPIPM